MKAMEKDDSGAKEQQKKRGRKRRSSSPLSPPVPFSFFKVLVGDFRDVLFVPPAIACTLKDLAEKYVNLEDSDCNSWIVKMSMVEGSLAFEKGWLDFVMGHSISVGEFVIFTYVGGLMFTTRIFAISSLERLNFQTKRNECTKEMVVAKLNSKRKKTSKASDDKHSPASHNPLSFDKKRETAPCDLSKENANVSDSMSRRVSEALSTVERFLNHHSSSKIHDRALAGDSLSLEELNVVNASELPKSDGGSLAAVVPKSCINNAGATEQEEGKQDIEELTPEVHELEAEDKMRISGKMARNFSFDFKMLGNEPYNENTPAFSHITDSKRTPNMVNIELEVFVDELFHKAGLCNSVGEKATYLKMEDIVVEEISDELFDKAEGLCNNVDGKSKKFAVSAGMVEPGYEDNLSENNQVNFFSGTHALCEIEPPLPSTPTLDYTRDMKENMVRTSEGVDTEVKGVDENSATPCPYQKSRNNIEKAIFERTELVDFPSSHLRFTIQLSHDVCNFLELPVELICRTGKMKLERKVVVLQDPSMRSWPVLYHRSFNYVGFIGGWADFTRANCICKGDICKLELIDEKELLFRVQIRKA